VTRADAETMMRTGEAAIACALLALDPEGLKGAVLNGPGGPSRDGWIDAFRALAGERNWMRLPPHIGTDRLTGSLDVAATLKAGAPRHDPGLLAQADGAVLLMPSAERLAGDKAALIAAAMDEGPARFTLIACDEGIEDDEKLATILTERLAFRLDMRACDAPEFDGLAMDEARQHLPHVSVPERIAEGLCQTALALGIPSLRPALMAIRAAKASAALDGRREVNDDDAGLAARLVLAPRALRFPVAEDAAEPEQPPPPPESEQENSEGEDDGTPSPQQLSDMLLEAVKASLPQGLLADLEQNLRQTQTKSGAGSLSHKTGVKRGRPAGTKAGEPRDGARLSLIDTLRAAAPWQPLRRRAAPSRTGVLVERPDFRIKRFKQQRETTAIFVVDASGSAALHRMAEAKGAVELLLADCYVRRDRAALISFRGKAAELLLPPTRSLQRAKKSLADLPGGGGTPLSAGIEQAMEVALQVRRGGGVPMAVFLTDGKANIARDGTAERGAALRDAELAARAMKLAGVRTLMIDMSDARGTAARHIAEAMGASYLPLPHADAALISRAVGTALKAGG
jgi:magnesium chelatase subunit D